MRTRTLTIVPIFAALTAVGGFMKIPVPVVPFTLQVAAVLLAGGILGPRLGMLSQLIYVAIGLIGVPVFTEGGGPAYIFKPTFGYLIGFIVGAYVNGWLIKRFTLTKVFPIFLANLAGLLVVYLVGCVGLYFSMKFFVEQPLSLYQTVFFGFLLPVPGDLVICAICAFLISRILPRIQTTVNREVQL